MQHQRRQYGGTVNWIAATFGLVLLLVCVLGGLISTAFVVRVSKKGHGRSLQAHTVRVNIQSGGLDRTYLLHVPTPLPSTPASLVLCFHGGGGTAEGIEPLTKFSDLADKEGFVVVYPEAVSRNWNDGRKDVRIFSQRKEIDDISFVSEIIEDVCHKIEIDPKRIYACGISNGAIFSEYLATRLSDRIAAIADVAGALAAPYGPKFAPSSPVSVFLIHGTDDRLVPYAGGPVVGGYRGRVLGTDATAHLWVTANGCTGAGASGALIDANAADGCMVHWRNWGGGRGDSEVLLYTITGGGHTWPGAAQYLPKRIVGNVCREFNATEAIWNFFREHPKF